jgi:hypothetical protein
MPCCNLDHAICKFSVIVLSLLVLCHIGLCKCIHLNVLSAIEVENTFFLLPRRVHLIFLLPKYFASDGQDNRPVTRNRTFLGL